MFLITKMVSTLRLPIIIWFLVSVTARSHRKEKHNKENEVTFMKQSGYHFIALLVDVIKEDNVEQTGCLTSIITEEWVLTSAECTPPNIRSKGLLHIWYKNFNKAEERAKGMAKVLNAFAYPSYRHSEQPNLKGSLHNIGLLRTEPIQATKYGLLSAVDYKALSGFHGIYAGEKKDLKITSSESSSDDHAPLQIGSGVIFKCEQSEHGPKLMCIAPKCSSDKETYESIFNGGPLIIDGKIVGVMSAGDAPLGNIGFTPISPYLDWMFLVMATPEDDQRKSQ